MEAQGDAEEALIEEVEHLMENEDETILKIHSDETTDIEGQSVKADETTCEKKDEEQEKLDAEIKEIDPSGPKNIQLLDIESSATRDQTNLVTEEADDKDEEA